MGNCPSTRRGGCRGCWPGEDAQQVAAAGPSGRSRSTRGSTVISSLVAVTAASDSSTTPGNGHGSPGKDNRRARRARRFPRTPRGGPRLRSSRTGFGQKVRPKQRLHPLGASPANRPRSTRSPRVISMMDHRVGGVGNDARRSRARTVCQPPSSTSAWRRALAQEPCERCQFHQSPRGRVQFGGSIARQRGHDGALISRNAHSLRRPDAAAGWGRGTALDLRLSTGLLGRLPG